MDFEREGVPLLTRDNYNIWKQGLEAMLESRDCLDIVLGKDATPVVGINGATTTDLKAWRRLDATARTILGQGRDAEHRTYVQGKTTAKEWWDILREAREKKEDTDLMTAYHGFHVME